MLKANDGISRKISKDYQSTGFTVNLEGEVTASVGDAEAVMEQVSQIYDLAEAALDQQIERSQSIDAVASRDEDRSPSTRSSNGRPSDDTSHRPSEASDEPEATTKQINYLLSIGKRQKLSTAKLEAKIAEILGYSVGLYDLTKRQAGVVLDELTNNGKTATSNRI